MKNLIKLMAGMMMISMFVFTSCEKDEDPIDVPPVGETSFMTMTAYMVANDMDLPKILTSWIISAEAVHTVMTDADTTNDVYIIDIRSAADYATGHIDMAVNSPLADILTAAANADSKPIVVVCYTGQGAAHGVVALRLSGFPDATTMKWGMSGWNANNDSWTTNVSDFAMNHANFISAPGDLGGLINYGDPVLTTTGTDGASMLEAQVTKMLTNGFQGVAGQAVVDAPTDYYINNYWKEADVIAHGNIKTAVRILPLSIAGKEYQNYNPSAVAVTYCWTGQTSSMITAYMSVLGYDAKSLKFGANSMIHSDLGSHSWNVSMAKNYPVVQ